MDDDWLFFAADILFGTLFDDLIYRTFFSSEREQIRRRRAEAIRSIRVQQAESSLR